LTSRASRFAIAASLAATLCLVSVSSKADLTKGQCVDANAKGQDLRRDGKLTEAREQLRQCSAQACPAMVRDDCTKRLDELEGAQPTIAFEVKDTSGADVSAVKVTVDGQPLTDKLDGTALPVDRGTHVFTFIMAGQPPVTRTFVLTEGEKGRRERIALGVEASPAPLPAPGANGPSSSSADSSSAGPASSSGGMGAQKILGLVSGAVGVAGVAVGGVFTAMALSEKNQQTTDCPNATCSSTSAHALAVSAHSAGTTDTTISTVGFIAGGTLLVGGLVLFFTAGHPSERRASTGLLVTPCVGPGGGGLFLNGEF
jgi:hypothetical protein